MKPAKIRILEPQFASYTGLLCGIQFENGVSVVSCVWRIASGSLFAKQSLPSLDYYIKLSKGLSLLRKKYELYTGMDDYRRCGNHPDTDLDRI